MSRIWDTVLKNMKKIPEAETGYSFEKIPDMKFSEFENRDLAIEAHSSVLGDTVWLCSDKEMEAQIKRENPLAVCYTAAELRLLTKLNPSSDNLRTIHEAKVIYPGSIIKKVNMKNELKGRSK